MTARARGVGCALRGGGFIGSESWRKGDSVALGSKGPVRIGVPQRRKSVGSNKGWDIQGRGE